jgi:hypothetical protein
MSFSTPNSKLCHGASAPNSMLGHAATVPNFLGSAYSWTQLLLGAA